MDGGEKERRRERKKTSAENGRAEVWGGMIDPEAATEAGRVCVRALWLGGRQTFVFPDNEASPGHTTHAHKEAIPSRAPRVRPRRA